MSPGTVAAMEGVTPSPSSSSQSDTGDAMETRFADICKVFDARKISFIFYFLFFFVYLIKGVIFCRDWILMRA